MNKAHKLKIIFKDYGIDCNEKECERLIDKFSKFGFRCCS